MNVLLIEDDENKRQQLISFVRGTFTQFTVSTAGSYHSGLLSILSSLPDLVLLDMTMPSFDVTGTERGGLLRGYGGREVLEELDRRDLVVPVIVVTQFDRFGSNLEALTLEELGRQLQEQYPNMYHGAVFYNSARESWKHDLGALIQTVERRQKR